MKHLLVVLTFLISLSSLSSVALADYYSRTVEESKKDTPGTTVRINTYKLNNGFDACHSEFKRILKSLKIAKKVIIRYKPCKVSHDSSYFGEFIILK